MSDRLLLSLRRRIPVGSRYEAAWEAVRQACSRTGAHAWRFASLGDETLQLEFIEFRRAAADRVRSELDAALRSLEELAPAIMEEWVEIPPRNEEGEGR